MSKFKKPELEIFHFQSDIITTSSDHDNGYIDSGVLSYIISDIKEKFF